MSAGHIAELLGPFDAGKQHKVLDRVFVSSLGGGIADILEPLGFGRNLGQALELSRREQPGFACDLDERFHLIHRRILVLIKSVIKTNLRPPHLFAEVRSPPMRMSCGIPLISAYRSIRSKGLALRK